MKTAARGGRLAGERVLRSLRTMSRLVWEWTLPTGEVVAATLDPEAGTESVYVGGELASSGARGARPDGHAVSSGAAALGVVRFDPRAPICVLREPDGHEVVPRRWAAASKARGTPTPPRVTRVVLTLLVLAGLGLAAGAAFAIRAATSAAPEAQTSVHRANNGLFVARFPATFTARSAVLPEAMSGVVLEDQARGDAIVLVALREETTRDPWLVHQRVHGEALANVPRADGTYDERARNDDVCHGAPGAVVLGRIKGRRGEPAKVWSCAFLHDGAAYVAMYSTAESTTARDEARLREVIDATELTRLEGLRGPPR